MEAFLQFLVVLLNRQEKEFLYELTMLQNRYFHLIQASTIMLSVALSLVSVSVVGIVIHELEVQEFGLFFFSKLGVVVFVGFTVIVVLQYYRDRERDKLAKLAEEIKRKYVW